jgi:hypothetical protein
MTHSDLDRHDGKYLATGPCKSVAIDLVLFKPSFVKNNQIRHYFQNWQGECDY